MNIDRDVERVADSAREDRWPRVVNEGRTARRVLSVAFRSSLFPSFFFFCRVTVSRVLNFLGAAFSRATRVLSPGLEMKSPRPARPFHGLTAPRRVDENYLAAVVPGTAYLSTHEDRETFVWSRAQRFIIGFLESMDRFFFFFGRNCESLRGDDSRNDELFRFQFHRNYKWKSVILICLLWQRWVFEKEPFWEKSYFINTL